MQNYYDLNSVALIYLAGPLKHNFMFFPFWPHKVEDKAHARDLFFHYFLETCLDFCFSPFLSYII